ncbi:MAG: glyoxylase-like metal-dependent hydrolase (beta-lactamase superfamily II) [Planctomycetota bacterium]|jgi:glyoxylase-like metal-dependent hydrolase (beta-lactamase superfamily II)
MSLRAASLNPPAGAARSVRVGEWTITELSDGHLRLDGGAMWGVVPRAMWGKWTPPDEEHRILLAARCFLAERGDDVVVIEGGIGERWEPRLAKRYGIQSGGALTESLRAAGREPEEVTHAIASHCHWDHIGAWLVEQDGELVPRFPNARYLAPADEIEAALQPDSLRRASYRAEDLAKLHESGRLQAYSGTCELLPGFEAEVVAGHSGGIALLSLVSGSERAVFWADIVPTAHHAVHPAYIMAYDINAELSYNVRARLLGAAADENWLGLCYHDPDVAFFRLERDGGRFSVLPVEGETRTCASSPSAPV